MEECFYTILDQRDDSEVRLSFRKVEDLPYGETNIALRIFDNYVKMDSTQLTELGALLIALGGGKIDHDDVGELFDGYKLGLKLDVHSTILGE